MSSYFNVWKKKLANSGGNETQSRLNASKNFFNREFKNDPSYKIAILKKRDILDEESDLDTRIVNVDTNTLKKKIFLRPDTNIEVGDYIIYPDKTYLVLQVESNLVSPCAECQECNHLFKWMINGKYYEQLGIATDKTGYTQGIINQNSSGFTEVSYIFSGILPDNLNTRTLVTDVRFILNRNAWRLTRPDYTSVQGLYNLLLGKDSISETDNLELEIADYYANQYSITLNSTSQTLNIGGTYQVSATVNNNGKPVSSPNINWVSSDNTIATVDSKGLVTSIGVGTCIITANVGSVSATLNLTVIANTSTNPVISYTCNWSTGQTTNGVLLKVYSSSTASIKKTTDGVVDSSLVANYTLDSIGTSLLSSGSISITKKSNTEFLIKNINYTTSKSFVIIFTNNADNSVMLSQTVQLSGM